jgi:hypothetical protein
VGQGVYVITVIGLQTRGMTTNAFKASKIASNCAAILLYPQYSHKQSCFHDKIKNPCKSKT